MFYYIKLKLCIRNSVDTKIMSSNIFHYPRMRRKVNYKIYSVTDHSNTFKVLELS